MATEAQISPVYASRTPRVLMLWRASTGDGLDGCRSIRSISHRTFVP